MGAPPAFTMSRSSRPGGGAGPRPMSPFSDWRMMETPAGRWFTTSVGRPMPRFTTSPERKIRAMRLAMTSLSGT